MGLSVIPGKPGGGIEAALRDRLAAARRNDPFSPLTILVGSNLLAAYLRRILAEETGGLFNVRFATFADCVSLIAREAPGGTGAPAPAYADRAVVGELVARGEISSGLAEAAATKGFADALIATFSDLAEAGCTHRLSREILRDGELRDRAGGISEEVLLLFARFRERIESLGGDIHSLFEKSISMTLPQALGRRIFAYGFYDFNEMQRRILARLARERDVTVIMPWGEGEAFRFAARARAALERRGFAFADPVDATGGVGSAPKPKLLNVPGEEEEVRAIARMILSRAKKGSRFADVAVILPSVETYAPLCREVFREAGIPFAMHAGCAADAGPAVRGALALLGILGGTVERRELADFLVSAPLHRPAAGRVRADPFSRWIRLSAEAGIVGERGWLEESARLVERLRLASEQGGDRGGDLAAAREADAVIAKIARSGGAMRALVSWRELARAFSALARDLFRGAGDLDSACAAVESLAALDRLGSPASFGEFARIAGMSLADAGRVAVRSGGDGVNVLSLSQARGLTFEAVFIPGLAERIFPTAARQDPLLGDRARRALNEASNGAIVLSEKAERLSEEALLFDLARAAAREELVCSYPRFEEGTGRERIPSSFLRFIEGYSIDGAHGAGFVCERLRRGAPTACGAEILSAHELDFERARAYRGGAGSLPDNPFFSKGARLVRERWGARRFTPYDGVFSSKKALGEMRKMIAEEGHRFAPTSLEVYARCPFAYYLTRVLGIDAREEPERVVSIGPLERGTLVHRILARIFEELKGKDLVPLRAAPAAEVIAIAERVIARMLGTFAEEASVGYPVFWDMEKRLVRESVLLFLEEERLEPGDFVPELFERSFGGRRDGLDVSFECGDRTLLFRGRIDRIDTASGGRFRVVDYKTGKLDGKDQDLARGSALQLPVYLLAASRILGLDLSRGEARYRRVGIDEGKSVVSFFGNRWEESREAFARIVDTIAGGVERGVFFAPADDHGCRNCDVAIACPSGMARLFEGKAADDERARPYVDMRGGGEEGA